MRVRHELWPFSFDTSFRHDPRLFDAVVEIAMLLSLLHIAGLQRAYVSSRDELPACGTLLDCVQSSELLFHEIVCRLVGLDVD